MFGINQTELIFFLFVALLLFGKRLPEVARSMGKGVTEFKKGLRGFEEEVKNEDNSSSTASPKRPNVASDEQVASAPKFQPPTAPPVEAEETAHA